MKDKPLVIHDQVACKQHVKNNSMSKEEVRYELSYAQERVYSAIASDSDMICYNIPIAIALYEDFDAAKLKWAVTEAMKRHNSFGMSFHTHNGQIYQRENTIYEIEFITIVLSDSDILDFSNKREICALLNKNTKNFDLEKAPLLRAVLFQDYIDQKLLYLDVHHLVADGLSMTIFIDEVFSIYRGLKLVEVPMQYTDYIALEKDFQKSTAYIEQQKYWKAIFQDGYTALNLVTDYPRPAIRDFHGDYFEFEVEEELMNSLRKIGRKTNTSLYMICLCAFIILLYKQSRQEDITVGTVSSGRENSMFQNSIGMFAKTLPLRSFPKDEKTILEYLLEIKRIVLDSFQNSGYPYQAIVSDLLLQREVSRNPLFDVMFVYDAIEYNLSDEINKYEVIPIHSICSKFDFTLTIIENKQKLIAGFEYCTQLFGKDSIKMLSEEYVSILSAMANKINIRIQEINLVSDMMQDRIINSFGKHEAYYEIQENISGIFRQQAILHPDQLAVVCGKKSLTYKELDDISDKIAIAIIHKGICRGSIIGLMVQESVEIVVGILSILKAGCAYLPILPDYPLERILFMLEDSDASGLLTVSEYMRIVKWNCVMDMNRCAVQKMEKAELPHADVFQMAYVIYTSGTTGTPKGVIVEQKSILNLVYALKDAIYENDIETINVGLIAAFVFDGSVKQIFPSLLLGHTLYIAEKYEKMSGEALLNFIINNKLEMCDCTPSHIKIMLVSERKILNNHSFKCLCVGGETLSVSLAESFRNLFEPVRPKIINLYGPTETTGDATYFSMSEKMEGSLTVPIGKPLSNVEILILDNNKKVVPIGTPGEIYIGGAGLSRGYINNRNQNKEKFLSNPYCLKEIIYRTGDLGRWSSDGNIEFIGRCDRQIKIRGYRVELEEIERQISNYNGIKQVVVLDKEDASANRVVCAYIVANKEILVKELRGYLEEFLPQYMIPAQFYFLQQIPVTSNGKINKEELLNIKFEQYHSKVDEDITELQRVIIEVWQDVLCVNNISIHDNFYALGGDSIKAIQIISRLQKKGYTLEIKDILRHPYVSENCLQIKEGIPNSEQGAIIGSCVHTPIQKYFFEERYSKNSHFNQSLLLLAPNGMSQEAVLNTLKLIVSQHDLLRAKVNWESYNTGLIIQELDKFEITLSNFEVADEKEIDIEIKDIARSEQEKVSIEADTLFRCSLISSAAGDYLLLNASHLVVDGISWRIIMEDFFEYYEKFLHDTPFLYPLKTDSYKYWAEKMVIYANSQKLLQERVYWKKVCQHSTYNFKLKNKIAIRYAAYTKEITYKLSQKYTCKLSTKVNQVFGTDIDNILLAALCLTLDKHEEKEKYLYINLEGHGREKVIDDINITRTVGWFTSIYPVAIQFSSGNIREQIIYAKEALKQVPHKGVGFNFLKYSTESVYVKDIDFDNKPNIGFNYMGEVKSRENKGRFMILYENIENEIGSSIREPYLMNIISYIIDGEYIVTFHYSSSELEKEYVNQIAKSYISNLEQCIDYCSKKDRKEYTPSDFTAAENLSIEDLKIITQKFNS